MDLKKAHKNFIYSPLLLVVVILFFIAVRFVTGDWKSPVFWSITVIHIVLALFLLHLNTTFVFIRKRTLLPAFFYLLFTGTNPLCFYSLESALSALIIALAFFFLFATHQKADTQLYAFDISLLLTVGSFIWGPLLLFFPLFWYGMYLFKSLNLRTFFAGVAGFLMIYLFLFTWSVYRDDLSLFVRSFPHPVDFGKLQLVNFSVKKGVLSGFLAFLFILSGVKIFVSGSMEKMKAVSVLGYMYLFTLLVFAAFVFQDKWESEWLSVLYIPASFLMSYFFTFSQKKWVTRLFFFTIVFFAGMLSWEYLHVLIG
ncbi:MAG: hypothetical protein LBH61_06965 [Dysgonamonadaceae bacterium]|jgi:hypothetical protein|nr:hypothetical protein [Dysgonamonadaceae bacterium]